MFSIYHLKIVCLKLLKYEVKRKLSPKEFSFGANLHLFLQCR